jgi:hypothetical protein
MKVEIGLLHDLPQAKMVITEPITTDDWEIIVSNQSLGLNFYLQRLALGNTCSAYRVYPPFTSKSR